VRLTFGISEGQEAFASLVKAAEEGSVVTVTRHGTPVAYVIGYERMTAIAETLEILGNPITAQAIAEHKAGKTKFGNLDDVPE
jgi:prevent-host-death family protein